MLQQSALILLLYLFTYLLHKMYWINNFLFHKLLLFLYCFFLKKFRDQNINPIFYVSFGTVGQV